MITTLQAFATKGYTQNAKVNIHMENAKIENILKEIEKQSDYRFFYDANSIKVTDVADVTWNSMKVSDALTELFNQKGIAYRLIDKQIVLFPTSMIDATATSQGITVTGTVTDKGEPMPGVTVIVKGTTIGVVTDITGRYTINVPNDKAVFQFTFVGYTPQDAGIGGRAVVNMEMEETDNPSYQNTPFVDEVKNRDLRLKQTIRLGDYKRTENGVPVASPPNFSQTYTGYQPIKWCYDERFPYDDESLNDNAHIIMRWGEVLLNKAEALAELGTMTDADWATTIGALRGRAGITGTTLTTMPTVADPYMIAFYKGKFTNPVLLEVMRERAVELIFEGLRPDDLKRWHVGELFQDAPMNGMYVPALGEYDLNGDGINDVCFYQGQKPASTNPAIAFVDVSTSTAVGRIQLSNGTSGETIWNPGPREWKDKKYLYPIPETAKVKNSALGQNPGWE